MLYTLRELRREWANVGSGEFGIYVRANFHRVYDGSLHFVGYERN